MMKQLHLRRGLALLLIIMLVATFFSVVIIWQWPDQYLHIVVCDVGQGDAILLSQGFIQVLVDAGLKDEDILHCLREQLPFWDRQIDWIVPTHLDADHIGGFAGVLDRFVVHNILLPRDSKNTADFERFQAAVLREQSGGGQVFLPTIGENVPLPVPWKLSVIYAPIEQIDAQNTAKIRATETTLWDTNTLIELNPSESNNRSTVLSVQYDQVSLLLTGDLEERQEQALVKYGLVTDHIILKVGHHGSKSSSSSTFLQVVRPEIVLVSVGKNNRYGHPATVTLQRLAQFGATEILRTDQLGTIVLKTDGQQVWHASSKH